MKTTLIFLACLLVINGAKLEKKCDRKAEEIFRQDCKHQCGVAAPSSDCARCIWKHQDYDAACKGDTRREQCWETLMGSRVDHCEENKENPDVRNCSMRFMDMKKLGLSCWADLVMSGRLHIDYV